MPAPALRVLLASDLHVDFPQNRPPADALAKEYAKKQADVLVIAGDVSHKLVQVEATLRQFAGFEGPKLFVAGNHDAWVVRPGPGDPSDSWEKLEALEALCERVGFRCLEVENARVGGFTFVGSMLWYDYSFADPRLGATAVEYTKKQWRDLTYMDAKYAKWGVPDAEVVERLLAPLKKRLAKAKPPVVFVSHHVPLEELVLRRGHASWDYFNAYMGSRRAEELLAKNEVTRFLFGHTHRPMTLIEPGRCMINNPLGYPREALHPVRKPFVIT